MYDQEFSSEQFVIDGDAKRRACNSIITGDAVMSPAGSGNVRVSFVDNITSSYKSVSVIRLETESGKNITLNAESVIPVSIPNTSFSTTHLSPDSHYVYLMYKREYGYRIGTTKNPRGRINGEHADRMWLIGVYNNATEALYYENLLCFSYGVPTMTFVDHISADKRKVVARITQSWIDRLFNELDTEGSATELCKDIGVILSHLPHIVPQSYGKRVSVYLKFFNTPIRNGKSKRPSHTLSVETSDKRNAQLIEENSTMNRTKSKKDGSRFRMSTIDFKKVSRQAFSLCNILDGSLVIRPKIISKKSMSGFYSLQPIGCHAANILEGFMLPVLVSGHIELERIVSIQRFPEKIREMCSLRTDNSPIVCVNNIFVFSDLV